MNQKLIREIGRSQRLDILLALKRHGMFACLLGAMIVKIFTIFSQLNLVAEVISVDPITRTLVMAWYPRFASSSPCPDTGLGLYVADIYLDHSTGHGAFAPDSLNALEMNVKPGGNQRRMHSTKIPDNNPNPELCGRHQEMNFPIDLPTDHPYYEFRGQPKGMRVVLDRWRAGFN